MSGHLSPIQLDSYRPLRELVCETIRQAIVDGVFSPGERLMEIQLADEMGVSRTPVREAIRKLELEGFVVMIPRRGPQAGTGRLCGNDTAPRHLCGRYFH